MRVSILLALAGSALFTAGCSDAGISQIRRRADNETAETAKGSDGSKGGSNANPTPAPADSPVTPPPSTPSSPDGGATPAPTPDGGGAPPANNTCTTPKCFGIGGYGGCKATDSAGNQIKMGCQTGDCACQGGSNADFAGDVSSTNDAVQLFIAHCGCK